MALTFFGYASYPADNGTNTTSPVPVTPPASMLAGDLVVFFGNAQTTTGSVAISNTGGQTWTEFRAQANNNNCRHAAFFCRFNGTWSANPSMTGRDGYSCSAVMLVFRPTTASNQWVIDNASANTAVSAPGSPYTITLTGITNTDAETVAIGWWIVAAANTFSTLSGAGWSQTNLLAQYRNSSSSAHSHAFAYYIGSGATGNVSLNESAGTAGAKVIGGFRSTPIAISVSDTTTLTEGTPAALIFSPTRYVTVSDTTTVTESVTNAVRPVGGDILAEGFENASGYDVSGWSETKGTNDIVDPNNSSVARCTGGGNEFLKIAFVSPSFDAYTQYTLAADVTKAYVSCWINFPTAGTAAWGTSTVVLLYDVDGTWKAALVLAKNDGNQFQVSCQLNDNGTEVNIYSGWFDCDTWIYATIYFDTVNYQGTIAVGATPQTATVVNQRKLSETGNKPVRKISIGSTWATAASIHYADNVYISGGLFPYPATLGINVSDTSAVTESVSIDLTRKISVSDTTTVTESCSASCGVIKSGTFATEYDLSGVAGTSFVDFRIANSLTPYINGKLTITDGAGKKAVGYIKAVGTGETYGSELAPNTSFSDLTNVSGYNATIASVAGGQSGNCLQLTDTNGTTNSWYENITTVAYALYRLTGYIKKGTQTQWYSIFVSENNGDWTWYRDEGTVTPPDDWTLFTNYATVNTTDTQFGGQAMFELGKTGFFDTISFKQVLTPSTTGVTIVSTRGGSTYDWTSIATGFEGNTLASYTIELLDTSEISVSDTSTITESVSVSIESLTERYVNVSDTSAVTESITTELVILTATGSVTYSNIRMNFISGSVFADFSAEGTLTPYIGWKLTIIDSAGQRLVGYIKAAGTGETYTEILADTSFDNAGSWTCETGWSVSGGNAIAVDAPDNEWIYQTIPNTIGQLFKTTIDCTSLTDPAFAAVVAGAQRWVWGAGTDIQYLVDPGGFYNKYAIRACGTMSGVFASFSCKKVLTPAVTGVTIVSTSGGSTYEWASEESGFYRNANSNYTYEIELSGLGIVVSDTSVVTEVVSVSIPLITSVSDTTAVTESVSVSIPLTINVSDTSVVTESCSASISAIKSGSVSFDNIRLSLASNTGFVDFSLAGSLTPYLNGKLTLTDSAGKKAVGYIKAAGTGETYGSELFSNTDFENTTGINTWQCTVASVAGGQSGNCLQTTSTATNMASSETVSHPAYACLKFTSYMKGGTETVWQAIFLQEEGDDWSWYGSTGTGTPPVSWTLFTIHLTPSGALTNAGWQATGTTGRTGLFDTASIKQVLTPSATGVTIVSTRGGSTYDWASMESGFIPYDSNGYTYTIELLDTSQVSVSDTTAVTESVSVYILLSISVSDTTAVTESVSVAESDKTINVSDTTAVTESVTGIYGIIPDIGAYEYQPSVTVSDTTAVTEFINVSEADEGINVSDTSVITELVAVAESDKTINVSDTTTVTEATTVVESDKTINVSDTTTVTEAVTVAESDEGISVSDTSTITEFTVVSLLDLAGSVSDTSVVTDAPTVEVESLPDLLISVQDTTVVTENVSGIYGIIPDIGAYEYQPSVTVSDTTAITEFINVSEADSTITVSDTSTVTEVVMVAESDKSINVSDTSIVIEFVLISESDETINVSDTSVVIESINVSEEDEVINVSDTTAVTEYRNVSLPDLAVSTSDTSVVTEYVLVSLSSLTISVSDTTLVQETLGVSNLITSWTNGVGSDGYDNFTASGSSITEAHREDSSTHEHAYSNAISVTQGLLYKLVATITMSGGQVPSLSGSGGFGERDLSAGANAIYFVPTESSVVLTVHNTAAAEWTGTFILKLVTNTLGITETIRVLIPDYYVSVSDTSVVTESRNISESAHVVNISDTTAVTEVVGVSESDHIINVSDISAVTEVAGVSESDHIINVSDTTVVTEYRNISESDESISVSDTSIVSEILGIDLPLTIDVSDTSVVSETSSVDLPLTIDVSDITTVTDGAVAELTDLSITVSATTVVSEGISVSLTDLDVNVFDITVITDVVIVEVEVPSDLLISVQDMTDVSENIDQLLTIAVNVEDTTDVTESQDTRIEFMMVLVTDTTIVTESREVSLEDLQVAVSDITEVAEFLAVALDALSISVSDTTSLFDREIRIVKLDNLAVNVSDTSLVSEMVEVFVPFFLISVSDDTTISEVVTALIPFYLISVSDTTEVTEGASAEFESPSVSVSDTTVVTEYLSVELEALSVSVSDTSEVTEEIGRLLTSVIDIFDTSVVSEYFSVELDVLSINVLDTTTVTEYTNVSLEDLNVLVFDISAVTEFLGAEFDASSVGVDDTTTVIEEILVSLVTHILVIQLVEITEFLGVVLEPQVFVSDVVEVSEYVDIYLDSLEIFVDDVVEISDISSTIIENPGILTTNVSETSNVGEYINLLLPELHTLVSDDVVEVFDVSWVELNVEEIRAISIADILEFVVVGISESEVGVVDVVSASEWIVTNLDDVEVFVTDNANITDICVVEFEDEEVFVDDSVDVSEIVSVHEEDLEIFIAEFSLISEDLAVSFSELGIVVFDVIEVFEISVVEFIGGEISVTDISVVTEWLLISVSVLEVGIFDSVNVTEYLEAWVPFCEVQVLDVVDIFEFRELEVSAAPDLDVDISDVILIAENVFVVGLELYISCSDAIAVIDSCLVEALVFCAFVSDFTSLTEVVGSKISDCLVFVSDLIFVTESGNRSLVSRVSVVDSVSVSEYRKVDTKDLNVFVVDRTTVSEIKRVLSDNLKILASDSIVVQEGVVKGSISLKVLVFDVIRIRDYRTVKLDALKVVVLDEVDVSEFDGIVVLIVNPVYQDLYSNITLEITANSTCIDEIDVVSSLVVNLEWDVLIMQELTLQGSRCVEVEVNSFIYRR